MLGNVRNASSTAVFAQSAAAKVGIIAVNAMTGIITARALEPAGRGELSVLMLWYSLFANLFTLGIPSALTYHLKRNAENKAEFLGSALVLSLSTTCVVTLVAGVFLDRLMPSYPPHIVRYARMFLLNTPISAFLVLGRATIESSDNFALSNLSLLTPPILTLIGLCGLLASHSLTPVMAAWVYVLSGIPSVIMVARGICAEGRPKFGQLLRSSRTLLSYGIRSYGIDICGTMAIYVDQAFVVRLFVPSVMGTYVVALSLSRMLNAFHTSVVMVLFPRAVSRTPLEVIAMTGRAVRLTTLLTSASGLIVMLIGPTLLRVLYGGAYAQAGSLLDILVVEVVIAGATQVLSQAFMALARPGIVTTLQIVGLLFTIPCMAILIPRYGISGAATALLISSSTRFLFVLISFPVFLGLRMPVLRLNREDLRMVFQSLWSVYTSARARVG